jgi:hypothetical protein
MQSIRIAYRFRIEGLQFREIDFFDTTPKFKNILLRQIDENNYRYELLIRKNTYSTAETQLRAIFNESSIEADKFKYIFSVAADVKIFDFECIGYYHNDQLVNLNSIFNSGGIRLSVSVTATVTAGEPSITALKEKMKLTYDMPSIQMFYDAATIIEPIGRFISLYTLLLHKYEDNQKAVDDAILSVDSTVGQFKSPFIKGYETVFSKYRNELSHKRDGTNILETHNEIKLNLDRFEEIVKILVNNKP